MNLVRAFRSAGPFRTRAYISSTGGSSLCLWAWRVSYWQRAMVWRVIISAMRHSLLKNSFPIHSVLNQAGVCIARAISRAIYPTARSSFWAAPISRSRFAVSELNRKRSSSCLNAIRTCGVLWSRSTRTLMAKSSWWHTSRAMWKQD